MSFFGWRTKPKQPAICKDCHHGMPPDIGQWWCRHPVCGAMLEYVEGTCIGYRACSDVNTGGKCVYWTRKETRRGTHEADDDLRA